MLSGFPNGVTPKAQWEDGYAVDAEAGVLVVADGASDGVFTKKWVHILLTSYLASPLPLDDMLAVEPWIKELRKDWFKAINYPNLRYSLLQRVDTSCGAATMLAFRLDAPEPSPDESAEPGPISWTAWAVGDVCLFHVRDGSWIKAFPIEQSSDFNYIPRVYQSKALLPTPEAKVLHGDLLPGDVVLFATDAVAKWMLIAVEAAEYPNCEQLLDVDQEVWRREIEDARDRDEIVNDDCTLLILRLPPREPVHHDASAPSHAAEPRSENEPALEE